MAFSGGGSNILKPHKHNSLVLQDGGKLDFKNDTQSSMSQGSMCFSDGVHLQELVKPGSPSGELLQFATAATSPSWVATTGNLERLVQLAEYETVNATTNSVVLTFDSLDLDDYASLYLTFSGVVVGALTIQVKMGDAVTDYRSNYDQSDSGTWTNVNGTGASQWSLTDLDAGTWFTGQAWLFGKKQNEGVAGYTMLAQTTGSAGSISNSLAGGFTGSGSSTITTVTISTSASYFEQYSKFNLMGLKKS